MASAKLIERFKVTLPEFSPRSDEECGAWIDRAGQIHSLSEEAQLWCAAHLFAVSLAERPTDSDGNPMIAGIDGGGVGLIKTEAMGQQNVTYERLARDATQRRAFFSRTTYGRQFLVLEDTVTAASVRVI